MSPCTGGAGPITGLDTSCHYLPLWGDAGDAPDPAEKQAVWSLHPFLVPSPPGRRPAAGAAPRRRAPRAAGCLHQRPAPSSQLINPRSIYK